MQAIHYVIANMAGVALDECGDVLLLQSEIISRLFYQVLLRQIYRGYSVNSSKCTLCPIYS